MEDAAYYDYVAFLGLLIAALMTVLIVALLIRTHIMSGKVNELWLDKLYGPEEDGPEENEGVIHMDTINWKQKLSSRKFWIGVIIAVIGIVLCITGDVQNGLKLIAIGAGGYIGCETLVDVARLIFDKSASSDAADASAIPDNIEFNGTEADDGNAQ